MLCYPTWQVWFAGTTDNAQADKDPTLAVLQTTTYISVLQTTTYISVRTFLVFLKSAPRRRVIQEKKATIERSIPQWRYQPEDYIEFRVALIRITRLEVDFFYKTKKQMTWPLSSKIIHRDFVERT